MNRPTPIEKVTLEQFAENIRITRELEAKILKMPGTREVYLHLRWHSTHPGEECVICGETPDV